MQQKEMVVNQVRLIAMLVCIKPIHATPSSCKARFCLPKLSKRNVNVQNFISMLAIPPVVDLEFPILVDRFNGPLKFLSECFGEEFLYWDVKLLGKDYRQARVNVILLESARLDIGIVEEESYNL